MLLDPQILPVDLGWRLGFGIGAALGLCILLLRRRVPESPRWLLTHGHREEAEQTVANIEARVEELTDRKLEMPADFITIYPRKHFGFGSVIRTMFKKYWTRSLLAFSLMVSQAFLYNAVFFTYALILTRFYNVSPDKTGLYLFPFAVGNFLGPLLLGRFFDTIGRKQMISLTYTLSALILMLTGFLFIQGSLTATSQTILWVVIFFFASAAASSAYLTASEIFPLETRALAIALFIP